MIFSVSVLNEDWCWEEKAVEVEVVDRDVVDVAFSHTGYILSCSLSHDITLVRASCHSVKPIILVAFKVCFCFRAGYFAAEQCDFGLRPI